MLTIIALTAARMPTVVTQARGEPIRVRLRREARLIGLARAIAGVVVSTWRKGVVWHRGRMTKKALGALDDRILHDIGLRRSEIESVIGLVDAARRARGQIARG